jgi:hypothetical protein
VAHCNPVVALLAAGAVCVLASALAAAQSTDRTIPAGSVVVGVGNFSHIVTSLDRSVRFYRDVIGLEADGTPRVFSGGGEPVNLAALTLVVLRDPHGLMIELIAAP